jgi:hypothetical protein
MPATDAPQMDDFRKLFDRRYFWGQLDAFGQQRNEFGLSVGTGLNEDMLESSAFAYAKAKSPHRLLHMPLAPEIEALEPPHRRFVAGRSMRYVESSVALRVRDPRGHEVAGADDL